jgi:hypothetical protein
VSLISLIHPDDARSQRVDEKLGVSIESRVFNPVHDPEVDGGPSPHPEPP